MEALQSAAQESCVHDGVPHGRSAAAEVAATCCRSAGCRRTVDAVYLCRTLVCALSPVPMEGLQLVLECMGSPAGAAFDGVGCQGAWAKVSSDYGIPAGAALQVKSFDLWEETGYYTSRCTRISIHAYSRVTPLRSRLISAPMVMLSARLWPWGLRCRLWVRKSTCGMRTESRPAMHPH